MYTPAWNPETARPLKNARREDCFKVLEEKREQIRAKGKVVGYVRILSNFQGGPKRRCWRLEETNRMGYGWIQRERQRTAY